MPGVTFTGSMVKNKQICQNMSGILQAANVLNSNKAISTGNRIIESKPQISPSGLQPGLKSLIPVHKNFNHKSL